MTSCPQVFAGVCGGCGCQPGMQPHLSTLKARNRGGRQGLSAGLVVAGFVRCVAASRQGLVAVTMTSAFSQPLSLTGNLSSLSHQALVPPAAPGPLLRAETTSSAVTLSPDTFDDSSPPAERSPLPEPGFQRPGLSLDALALASRSRKLCPFSTDVSRLSCWGPSRLCSMSCSHWEPLSIFHLGSHLFQEAFPDPINQDAFFSPFAGASNNTGQCCPTFLPHEHYELFGAISHYYLF